MNILKDINWLWFSLIIGILILFIYLGVIFHRTRSKKERKK